MSGFVNLTPHTINLTGGEKPVTVPPSGAVARVAVTREDTGLVYGIPTFLTTYGEVEGLPVPEAGTIFIVSALVKQRVPGRSEVFSPGELVRDNKGQPIGCLGLTQ